MPTEKAKNHKTLCKKESCELYLKYLDRQYNGRKKWHQSTKHYTDNYKCSNTNTKRKHGV